MSKIWGVLDRVPDEAKQARDEDVIHIDAAVGSNLTEASYQLKMAALHKRRILSKTGHGTSKDGTRFIIWGILGDGLRG